LCRERLGKVVIARKLDDPDVVELAGSVGVDMADVVKLQHPSPSI
jgi:hypothetical protein